MQKLVFGPNVTVQTSHMAEVVGDFFLRFVVLFKILHLHIHVGENTKDRKIVGLICLDM